MKFYVVEDCAYSGGIHAEAGTVIEVSASEAANLRAAGRGHPVPDDFVTPAAKAAAEAKAAKKAEAEAAKKPA